MTRYRIIANDPKDQPLFFNGVIPAKGSWESDHQDATRFLTSGKAREVATELLSLYQPRPDAEPLVIGITVEPCQ